MNACDIPFSVFVNLSSLKVRKLSSSISTLLFQVSSTSRRERAARKAEKMLSKRAKLASSSSFKARKRKSTAGTTSQKGIASLTPAALSLLEKTKSIQSQSRDAFGSSLRKNYTPRIHSSTFPSSCMKNRRGSSQYRKRDHAYNSTPQT